MEVVTTLSPMQLQTSKEKKTMKSFDQLFNKTYSEYYPKVFKQLYYLLGNNELAEDITQEVFIKYYQSNEQLEYPGAWLSKVAVRCAYNHLRGEKRRQNREESVFDYVEEILSTEDEVFKNEEIRNVRKVLRQLDYKQNICLTLKFSGYSYDEIHQTTGIPRNNISQMIARGKQKFINLYKKEGE